MNSARKAHVTALKIATTVGHIGILFSGGQVSECDDGSYMVNSQSRAMAHIVRLVSGTYVCDCEDYMKRMKPCKHCAAVKFALRLPDVLASNSAVWEGVQPATNAVHGRLPRPRLARPKMKASRTADNGWDV